MVVLYILLVGWIGWMNVGGKGWCGKRKKIWYEMLIWCMVWYDMVWKMKVMGFRRSMFEKEMEIIFIYYYYNIFFN